MNIQSLSIPLHVSPDHSARLKSLQETFASVCNALASVVQETRCWNRVALHHMMYKTLREKFPQLGSQMVCNAIYSVSRTSRLVFQSAQSPFNIQLMTDKPLPLLQFLPSAPVYFDRHTLSLKSGSLSMYTLDGRMRFELNMKDEALNRFKTLKLHEIILQNTNDQFTLSFNFGEGGQIAQHLDPQLGDAYLPEYIVIDQLHGIGTSNRIERQQENKPRLSPSSSSNQHPFESTVNNRPANRTQPRVGIQVHLQLQQPLGSTAQSFTTAVPKSSLERVTSTDPSSNTRTISILPLGATP